MRPFDGQSDVIQTLAESIRHPALDAESLGRILLMLEWLVSSGSADPEIVDQLLAERTVGGGAAS